VAGVAGEEFRDDAEAIKIGRQAGADDGSFFATGERGGADEEPSGEEMSDRAHGRKNEFLLNACKARPYH